MSPIDFDELHDRHDALRAQPLVDRDPGDEDATELPAKERSLDGIRRGEWGPKLEALVRGEDGVVEEPVLTSDQEDAVEAPEAASEAETEHGRNAAGSAGSSTTPVRDLDAYEITDPKHPDHYETLVDIWDNRDKAA